MRNVIEFLQYTGQISETRNLFDADNPLVNFADTPEKGIFISTWNLVEGQPTAEELETIEKSQEFQDYLLNRDKILADKELAKSLENPALKIVLEKNEALTKQVNELIKLLQTSKDIAEINVEAGKLDPLPEKVDSIKVSVKSKK